MRNLFAAKTKALILLISLTFLASPLLAQDPSSSSMTMSSPAPDEVAQKDLDALGKKLDALCTSGDLAKTRVGVHVRDLATGQVLYARDADALYNPASNMKMVTSALALDLFGPAHTFTTTISAGDLQGSTIKGNLYVQGTGEGFLLYEDVLDWAAQIKNQGIDKLEGDVIVSDGPFKGGDYLPPGFEQKSEDASYRAAVGSVSVNFNATTITLAPGAKPGDAPIITLDPPNDHLEIDSSLTTVAGTTRSLSVQSLPNEKAGEEGGTIIKIAGRIGVKARPWSVRKRVDSPPLYAGSVFLHALSDMGIDTTDAKVSRGEPSGKEKLTKLVAHGSEPLTELLMAMNKWSNNFMAEQLFRAIGTTKGAGDARGSWEGSTAVMKDFLASKLGLKEGSDFRVKNGSGLYAGNGLSPRAITTLLSFMYRHVWSTEYISSMAIAGVDGTLASRFDGDRGRLRGKTGTLNEVSALSGYVTTRSGRVVAVSILLNDPPVRAWRLRSKQDEIAQAIIDFDR